MPSTLTVVLNSNHSKKFALLLPSLQAPKSTILREARNKFRLKALSYVYLQGGQILEDDENIREGTTNVWVSKGDPYNGPPLSQKSHLDCLSEVRIVAEKSFIDDKAVKQLRQTAELQGVLLAVGLPDLHPGNRFPVGCAIAAEGVYPALIGSDVGCGIALYHFASPRLNPNPIKLANLLRGLDDPWAGSVDGWLSNYGIERRSPFDQNSLGTVGAGNHFAEICTVERIIDQDAALRLDVQQGAFYLLIHTGSRGLGASILTKETTTDSNPYILPHSSHFAEYMIEHDYAVQWAVANRDLVAHRIKQCVHGQSGDTRIPLSHELGKIIDITHNSVTKHTLSIGDQEKTVWVHRKGAAPTDKGIVPCPGSRGDFSWLLEPIGDGRLNAFSLAHGAGRRRPRTALHESKIPKAKLLTTSLGSQVICTDTDLLLEERPEAYKDISAVVSDLEDKQLCKGVVLLRPVVTYKIREHGEAR